MSYRIEWGDGELVRTGPIFALDHAAREYVKASHETVDAGSDGALPVLFVKHDDGTDLSPSERDEFETILAAMGPL